MPFRLKYHLIILFILLLGSTKSLCAKNAPIEICSACLNQNDSTVTLKFKGANDSCGTFSKIFIKERVVQSVPLPFITVQTISTVPVTQAVIKQADLRQREYFLEYLYACNGSDTVRSDTFMIDFTPPNRIPIDSVSVDLASQRAMIGWPENTSSDYVGYIIYIRNGPNNVRIQDQNTVGYIHPTSNPSSNSISYTYNVFDSCDNKNPLADIHGTIHLTRRYDFCQREIELNWSPYIGWQTDKYSIYVAKNGTPYQKIGETSSLNFLINNIENGANYCFYVRSHKSNSTFTSSSNRVCQATPNPMLPQNTLINSISVTGENQINIKWSTQNPQSTFEAQIYRGTNLSNLTQIGSTNFTSGVNQFQDNSVVTNSSSYYYQIIIPDSCQENKDSSKVSESIFLNLEQEEISWNSYIFEIGNHIQTLIKTNTGSTWNLFIQGDKNLINTKIPEDSARCYKVYSISDMGDTSISNIQCIEEELRISVPSAIRPSSSIPKNQEFRIYGTGIDWNQTNIAIFDRWGGKVAELNSNTRVWKPQSANGALATGLYIYTGYVYGLRNEKQFIKGKITVVK